MAKINKPKDMVTITARAARELRAIQEANARDETHMLRLEMEGEGCGLWLGPVLDEDTVVGSEDTILLRASPDFARYLRRTKVIIDCVDYEDSQRLIFYPEGQPPPELLKAGKDRRRARPAASKQGSSVAPKQGKPAATRQQGKSGTPKQGKPVATRQQGKSETPKQGKPTAPKQQGKPAAPKK